MWKWNFNGFCWKILQTKTELFLALLFSIFQSLIGLGEKIRYWNKSKLLIETFWVESCAEGERREREGGALTLLPHCRSHTVCSPSATSLQLLTLPLPLPYADTIGCANGREEGLTMCTMLGECWCTCRKPILHWCKRIQVPHQRDVAICFEEADCAWH